MHHPVAAAAPDTYKTRQQEDHDQFLRRHEVHAVNEAIRKSREHLNNMSTSTSLQHMRYQEQTFTLPEPQRRSASPVLRHQGGNDMDGGRIPNGSPEHVEVPAVVIKRQTAGTC